MCNPYKEFNKLHDNILIFNDLKNIIYYLTYN